MAHHRVLRCGRYRLPLGARTYLMGILNITDDSFAGGGFLGDPDGAVRHARRLVAEGADLIDVGGESARADTPRVPPAQEIERVTPVIGRLARELDVPISIDTYKPEVAEAALRAGASMVNDIAGFTLGDETARLAARYGAAFVVTYTLMPPKVRPPQPPQYDDLIDAHLRFLRDAVARAQAAGLPQDSIVVDPGFAFGKTPDQDLAVLRHLGAFRALGCPLLVAPSRKAFVGAALAADRPDEPPPEHRVEGTAAVVALAVAAGTDIVRVHDVRAMADVARVADAVVRRHP